MLFRSDTQALLMKTTNPFSVKITNNSNHKVNFESYLDSLNFFIKTQNENKRIEYKFNSKSSDYPTDLFPKESRSFTTMGFYNASDIITILGYGQSMPDELNKWLVFVQLETMPLHFFSKVISDYKKNNNVETIEGKNEDVIKFYNETSNQKFQSDLYEMLHCIYVYSVDEKEINLSLTFETL